MEFCWDLLCYVWPMLFYFLINDAVKQVSNMEIYFPGTTKAVETKTDCEE